MSASLVAIILSGCAVSTTKINRMERLCRAGYFTKSNMTAKKQVEYVSLTNNDNQNWKSAAFIELRISGH